ncbi:hypothetical protein RHMOL_Rhmol02G0096600 [Rhododendron molle]|nr:hypothetical protein RHMOL_Rhmol02G0096600 [Rhododendron molle]
MPSAKALAVAQETLVIWCSLASRLGLWALKAELEDMCFVVLQPQIFRQMRADLALMWSPTINASDVDGGASNFPPLEDITEMKKLMLRSCNISGSIPGYLGNLPLTKLDLSYNRLEGNVTNLEAAQKLQWM